MIPYMCIKFQMDTFSSFEDGCCTQNFNQEFSKYKKGHNSVEFHARVKEFG